MERGSIYWINLSDCHPPEMGKIRPGVIVSNSHDNLRLPTVVVVPLSTQPPEAWPFRIAINSAMTHGDEKPGFAIVPRLRQVSKRRLEGKIGILAESEIQALGEAIATYLRD